jgi:hypothetical protein
MTIIRKWMRARDAPKQRFRGGAKQGAHAQQMEQQGDVFIEEIQLDQNGELGYCKESRMGMHEIKDAKKRRCADMADEQKERE